MNQTGGLELPIPTYDPSLLSYLKSYGNGLLEKVRQPEPDLRKQIEALLVDNLPGHLMTAKEVAASLGMGYRTFTRCGLHQGPHCGTLGLCTNLAEAFRPLHSLRYRKGWNGYAIRL